MSARRSISWSNFRNDLRADRVQVPAGFLGARGRVEGMVRFSEPSCAEHPACPGRRGRERPAGRQRPGRRSGAPVGLLSVTRRVLRRRYVRGER